MSFTSLNKVQTVSTFLGDKPTTSPIDTRLFREISLVTEHSNIANVHFEIIRCDLKVFRKDLKKKRGMAKINYSDFHPHEKLVIMQASFFEISADKKIPINP